MATRSVRGLFTVVAAAAALSGCVMGDPCAELATTAAAGEVAPPYIRCRAERDDKAAQYRLGRAYAAEGEFQEAAIWYERAAAPRREAESVYAHPVGNERFGRVLPSGPQPPSPGFIAAQIALAELYLTGAGVEPDRGEAIRWLERAARSGSDEAKDRLAQLGGGSN